MGSTLRPLKQEMEFQRDSPLLLVAQDEAAHREPLVAPAYLLFPAALLPRAEWWAVGHPFGEERVPNQRLHTMRTSQWAAHLLLSVASSEMTPAWAVGACAPAPPLAAVQPSKGPPPGGDWQQPWALSLAPTPPPWSPLPKRSSPPLTCRS